MSKKNKLTYYSYMEGNIRYMSCKVCGRYEQVGDEATSVKCSRCTIRSVPLEEPKGYKPTGRPAGWHWMKEFVDKDGTVYHLGKEQPKLKGTLKPTKVSPPKKKKIKRRTKQQMLLAMDAERKAELKKAHQKQKDFINHNINKG
jgi:hypothetical protein